jgi:hypothetical protein
MEFVGLLVVLLIVVMLLHSASKNEEQKRKIAEYQEQLNKTIRLSESKIASQRNAEYQRHLEAFLNALQSRLDQSPAEFLRGFYLSKEGLSGWSFQSKVFEVEVPLGGAPESSIRTSLNTPADWSLIGSSLIYRAPIIISWSKIQSQFESCFKERFLKDINKSIGGYRTIYDYLISNELYAGSFKTYKSGGRYRKNLDMKYIDYGPFEWLVTEKLINKGSYTRATNKHMDSIVANGQKLNKPSVESLNRDISTQRVQLPQQPFVVRQESTHKPAPVQPNEASTPKKALTPSVDIRKPAQAHTRPTASNDNKFLGSATSIYILLTPFQADCPNGYVDIKIGESTNIEGRIKDYIAHWQHRFKVIKLLDKQSVQDESDIHTLLQRWRIFGEYYQVSTELLNEILQAESSLQIKSIIRSYEQNRS